MDRKITVELDSNIVRKNSENFEISGWFSGKLTYLWFGTDKLFFATLSGQKLYKLAKKIVEEFERDKL